MNVHLQSLKGSLMVIQLLLQIVIVIIFNFINATRIFVLLGKLHLLFFVLENILVVLQF